MDGGTKRVLATGWGSWFLAMAAFPIGWHFIQSWYGPISLGFIVVGTIAGLKWGLLWEKRHYAAEAAPRRMEGA